MNERLVAMLRAASLRDGIVVRLFLVTVGLLVSAGALHASHYPPRIKSFLIGVQVGIYLFAWFVLLIILALITRAT